MPNIFHQEPPLQYGFTRYYRKDGYPDWIVEQLRSRGEDAYESEMIDFMEMDQEQLSQFLNGSQKTDPKTETAGLTEDKLTNALTNAFDSILNKPEIRLAMLTLQALGSIIVVFSMILGLMLSAVRWLWNKVLRPILSVVIVTITFVNLPLIVGLWLIGYDNWFMLAVAGSAFGWSVEGLGNFIYGFWHGQKIRYMTTPNRSFNFFHPTFLNYSGLRSLVVSGIWRRESLNRWLKRNEATFTFLEKLLLVVLLIVAGVIFSFGWVFMFAAWYKGWPMWQWILLSPLGWWTLWTSNYLFGLATGLKIETLGGFMRKLLGMEIDWHATNPLYSKPIGLNFLPMNEAVLLGMKHRYWLHWMWKVVTDWEFRIAAPLSYDYPNSVRNTARVVNRWSQIPSHTLNGILNPLRFGAFSEMVVDTPHRWPWYTRLSARFAQFLRVELPLIADAILKPTFRTQILSNGRVYPEYVRYAQFGHWCQVQLADLKMVAGHLKIDRFLWLLTTTDNIRRWNRERSTALWPDQIAIKVYDTAVWIRPYFLRFGRWLVGATIGFGSWLAYLAEEWSSDNHGTDVF